MMRNPTTREFSDFFYACSGWNESEWPTSMQVDPAQYFHTNIAEALTLFNNCLKAKNKSVQWCFGKVRSLKSGCGYVGRRLPVGLYHFHLLKWMQFYPRENFLLLRTEDINKEPYKMLTEITEFLGLDAVSEGEVKVWVAK